MGRRGRARETVGERRIRSLEESGWQWRPHRRPHIHIWWIKVLMNTLGASDPRPDCTVKGFRARKINPCNFWL